MYPSFSGDNYLENIGNFIHKGFVIIYYFFSSGTTAMTRFSG
jgi:hypothetical protein